MDIIKELEEYFLNEIVVDQGIDIKKIAPDEELLSEGIVDSLAVLKLTGFIEKTYGFKIEDEDLEPENFRTLERIKELIQSKLQGKK